MFVVVFVISASTERHTALIRILLLILLLLPTASLALDVGNVRIKNSIKLLYADNGLDTHPIRGEHRIRLSLKESPLWASNYYSVDYDADRKNSWQLRSTVGFEVNRFFDVLVERHEYSSKDREVYRAGIQLEF